MKRKLHFTPVLAWVFVQHRLAQGSCSASWVLKPQACSLVLNSTPIFKQTTSQSYSSGPAIISAPQNCSPSSFCPCVCCYSCLLPACLLHSVFGFCSDCGELHACVRAYVPAYVRACLCACVCVHACEDPSSPLPSLGPHLRNIFWVKWIYSEHYYFFLILMRCRAYYLNQSVWILFPLCVMYFLYFRSYTFMLHINTFFRC